MTQTNHRVFKVWHRSPGGNFWRIKLVPVSEVQLGTASNYVEERGGRPREWKCDEGIRAAMWNGVAHMNRRSNVLKPLVAPLSEIMEEDCAMLLIETDVPAGWTEQVFPLLVESQYLDIMSKLRIAANIAVN